MTKKKKVLVIRFSSIGDLILTTPVIRALYNSGYEVHLLTKQKFSSVLESNSFIKKIHTHENGIQALFLEKYDLIVDCHKNLRSLIYKVRLRVASITFAKLNLNKFLLTTFQVDLMPSVHLVDRYWEMLYKIGINDDGQGLDYMVNESPIKGEYIAINCGATYHTKRVPVIKLRELIEGRPTQKFVLLGGSDVSSYDQLSELSNVISMISQCDLQTSASIVGSATLLITGDSALMHIGAALQVPTVVAWGATAPIVGMYPYRNKHYISGQVKNLSCQPCSKIGKKSCPKGHFKCMMQLPLENIVNSALAL